MIDIKAPCQEVFNTVVNLERRMQLSPLWGLNRLLEVTQNFPEPGSSYRVQILTGAPFGLSHGTLNATQSALVGLTQFLSMKLGQNQVDQAAPSVPQQPLTNDKQKPSLELPTEQEYFVDEYQPPHKLSYHLDNDCKTTVTWRFQNIPLGTRINYEEVFCAENIGDENFIPTIRNVIREWLTNIKRYCELRGGRGRLLVKCFLDQFYLKLRPDQRRVVLILLFMQAIGLATFVIAVIGWGIASLLF
ncbi:MAG: hypothetical protein JW963_22955 [Anaerolineales bacterium]|nr:hypothetical protein [Anaerolineales bacterium]